MIIAAKKVRMLARYHSQQNIRIYLSTLLDNRTDNIDMESHQITSHCKLFHTPNRAEQRFAINFSCIRFNITVISVSNHCVYSGRQLPGLSLFIPL